MGKRKKAAGITAILSMAFATIAGCGKPSAPFSASENIAPEIYGPPEMFEDYQKSGKSDSSKDVSESEEEFDPALNIEECIYGPPEMFEDPEEEGK